MNFGIKDCSLIPARYHSRGITVRAAAIATCVFAAASRQAAVEASTCHADPGFYLSQAETLSEYDISELAKLRFAATANLFQEPVDEPPGIPSDLSDKCALVASYDRGQWRMHFKDRDREGDLVLRRSNEVAVLKVDIHDSPSTTSALLYKEWRFEGELTASGMFASGADRATYQLVVQGRGNVCDEASDFRHWHLAVTGPKARYAFWGELLRASE